MLLCMHCPNRTCMPTQVTMIFQGKREAEKAEAAYEQMLSSHNGRRKKHSVCQAVVGRVAALCTPSTTTSSKHTDLHEVSPAGGSNGFGLQQRANSGPGPGPESAPAADRQCTPVQV